MNNRGFVITITTLFFVMLFMLFLSFTTSVTQKPIHTDAQMFDYYNKYVKFNSGDDNDTSVNPSKDHWCLKFFYYDSNGITDDFGEGIKYKKYCESYDKKRFI